MLMRRIRTPLEFGQTITGFGFNLEKWLHPPSNKEEEIRHAIDMIFTDLAYATPLEPDTLTSFLDTIKAPIDRLYSMELQIVAIRSKGKFGVGAGAMPVEWTHYVVASDPCYFAAPTPRDIVHRLGTRCSDGAGEIVRAPSGAMFRTWSQKEDVERAYESQVPWCAACAIEDDPPLSR